MKLIRTESKSIIADQDRVILKLYSTKYIKHNKTDCLHASTTMAWTTIPGIQYFF
jgi:hypothetical protein